MTVFLDNLSAGPAPGSTPTAPLRSVTAPATEGEIPMVDGINGHIPSCTNGNTSGVNGIKSPQVLITPSDKVEDPFSLNKQYAYTPRKLKVLRLEPASPAY